MRTRRTTHIELPVASQGSKPIDWNLGLESLRADQDKSFQDRVDELFAALRTQWQRGYEQALIDNDIDPETYVQPTRAPWS